MTNPESPYVPMRNEPANDPPPKRAFVLEINIGADKWDDVVHELRELADHIATHGPGCDSVAGGCTSGHWVHIHMDPTMTNERFNAELKAWLERTRNRRGN